jgi:hypothetical protein
MTNVTPVAAQVLRQVIRGELPLGDLTGIGIKLTKHDVDGASAIRVKGPPELQVSVSVEDLARGLLALRHDAAALRDWALFFQAFDGLQHDAETHASGEFVLETIWDACFGKAPDSNAVQRLQQVANAAESAA